MPLITMKSSYPSVRPPATTPVRIAACRPRPIRAYIAADSPAAYTAMAATAAAVNLQRFSINDVDTD